MTRCLKRYLKNIVFELESLAMHRDTLFLLSTSKLLPHMGVKSYSIASKQ